MSQFDVFRNPAHPRSVVPYLVCLQNSRFDDLKTRFVAALVFPTSSAIGREWLTPSFEIGGRTVVLDLFNLATLPASLLGGPVASLADEDSRGRIIRAVDEFLSQA